jgi:FtsZ-binding cell division protein ZapB
MQGETQETPKCIDNASENFLLASLSVIMEPLKEQNQRLQQALEGTQKALEEMRCEMNELRNNHNDLTQRYNELCDAVVPGCRCPGRFFLQSRPSKHLPIGKRG